MRQHLRALATDTALYGFASVLPRLLTFLLVPLYAHVLAPSELGPIGTVYGYIALASVLYGLGLETAFLRFAAAEDAPGERRVFSTSLSFLAGTGLATTAALYALRAPIAAAVGLPGHGRLIAAAAVITLLDTLGLIPLAWLRLHRRTAAFAAVRVTSLLVHGVLVLLLLLRLGHGAFGILEANLAASAAELACLFALSRRFFEPRLEWARLGALLAFALPLVPAGLAVTAVQVADRPLLQLLSDDATVGLYQVSSKIGAAMLFLATMFQYAWQPFFLTRAGDRDAARLFARVLTYYITFALGLFLALTLALDWLVALPIGRGATLIHPAYWAGMEVVPWLFLGYIAFGAYQILAAGPTIQGHTPLFTAATLAAALTSVAANLVLVPRFGLIAAGWSACLAYLVMAGGLFLASRRTYPVAYEWGRLLRAAAAALVLWRIHVHFGPHGPLARAGLLLAYPVLLAATGFLQPGERAALHRVLARLAGRREAR